MSTPTPMSIARRRKSTPRRAFDAIMATTTAEPTAAAGEGRRRRAGAGAAADAAASSARARMAGSDVAHGALHRAHDSRVEVGDVRASSRRCSPTTALPPDRHARDAVAHVLADGVAPVTPYAFDATLDDDDRDEARALLGRARSKRSVALLASILAPRDDSEAEEAARARARKSEDAQHKKARAAADAEAAFAQAAADEAEAASSVAAYRDALSKKAEPAGSAAPAAAAAADGDSASLVASLQKLSTQLKEQASPEAKAYHAQAAAAAAAREARPSRDVAPTRSVLDDDDAAAGTCPLGCAVADEGHVTAYLSARVSGLDAADAPEVARLLSRARRPANRAFLAALATHIPAAPLAPPPPAAPPPSLDDADEEELRRLLLRAHRPRSVALLGGAMRPPTTGGGGAAAAEAVADAAEARRSSR